MADKSSKIGNIPELQKIELLNDKTLSSELRFKVDGKLVTINERELHQLLQPYPTKTVQEKERNKQTQANAFDSNHAATNTTALAQHGLKSTRDLMVFLKSSGGRTAQALVQDHAAMLLFMKQQHTASLYRRELLKRLFRANHRLLKIARRRAEQKRINAINQRQVEKSLAYGRAAAQERPYSGSYALYPHYAIRIQIDNSYALSAKLIEEELTECYEASRLLEEEMAALEELRIYLDELHLHLEAAGTALEQHEEEMTSLSNVEEKIAYTQAKRNETKAEIKLLGVKIQEQMQKGNQQEAKQLMHQLDCRNIEALNMKVMLDVYRSDKSYYDAEGSKVPSYKKASYVVSNLQSLYKDGGGKFYLLEPGQKFNEMSAEEKVAAHNRFEQAKPSLSLAKQQIKHYVEANNEVFKQTSSDLLDRCNKMQTRILSLTKAQMALKRDQASTHTQLDSLSTEDTKAPAPKLTPRPSLTPEAAQYSPAKSYRHALHLMRLNPTPQAINFLKNSLVLPNAALLKEAQEAIDYAIKPYIPIPLIKMNNLLAHLERLGVSANKPSVTSIPNKHPNKLENQKSDNKSPNTAPTPFRTTLSPFKY